MDVTFENVKQVIIDSEVSGDLQSLEADTTFDAIGLDSLDRFNVLLAVEESFGVSMPEHEAESLDTINKLIAFIQSSK